MAKPPPLIADETKGRIIGLPESPISKRDYKDIMASRPAKFSEAQVGYRKATGKERCAACIHFYVNRASQRSVCQILRPKSDDSVRANWTCLFWTRNGQDLPLLEAERG